MSARSAYYEWDDGGHAKGISYRCYVYLKAQRATGEAFIEEGGKRGVKVEKEAAAQGETDVEKFVDNVNNFL